MLLSEEAAACVQIETPAGYLIRVLPIEQDFGDQPEELRDFIVEARRLRNDWLLVPTTHARLLGGAFRLAPEIQKWQDRNSERGHELAMPDRALKFERLRDEQRMGETGVAADAEWNTGAIEALQEAVAAQGRPSGVKWVDALSTCPAELPFGAIGGNEPTNQNIDTGRHGRGALRSSPFTPQQSISQFGIHDEQRQSSHLQDSRHHCQRRPVRTGA